LDPVEKAIRNALEKGNAEDRTFREKVYRSAFAALERATQAHPELTVETAIRRRQNLQAKITSIESEYLPAAPALPVHPGEVPPISLDEPQAASEAPSVEAPAAEAGGEAGAAPSVALDSEPETAEDAPSVDLGARETPEPVLAGSTPAATVAPDRDERRAKRRRPLAAMFVAVTLVCAAAIGGWWAYELGLFKLPSAPPPAPPEIVEEEFDPAEEVPLQPGEPSTVAESGTELRNWITVFSPDDPSAVNAPNGATAEVSEDESGEFMRIRSGTTGAAVVFDIGQGILEQIAGKKAVFDISARAEDGTQTQISISCDFGELGDCGRKRYAVGYERGEYLFDVELPGNRPGAGGSLAVNSDFSNEGKAVDIYEIRVSVVE
jgi:hypothetical protein